jgi:hypothetical protein
MPQPSNIQEFTPLLKAARPTVYETNAFRLIGVANDADTPEINRQLQRLEFAVKFGAVGQQSPGRILQLKSQPTTLMLQDAKQRLVEPESRLIEEFFWFWPEEPRGIGTDLAWHALQRGDTQSAIEIWTQRAKEPSDNTAFHNLAILFHLQALDSTNAGKGSVPESLFMRAWKYWRILTEHEPFWGRLRARIEELDDPRLTARTAAQIRYTLRSAIFQIDLSLAIAAAEAGNLSKAGIHLKIGRESGFAAEIIRQRVERALSNIKIQIGHLCDEAEKKSADQVEQTPDCLEKLLTDSNHHLEILNYCVGRGSSLRDTSHDNVAETIRSTLVAYGNKTENWKTCEQLLTRAAALAASESQKKRIADDLDTVKWLHLTRVCWFCKDSAANDSSVVVVEMYGDVTRTPTQNGTHIEWRNLPVKVPRCQHCQNVHLWRKVALVVSSGTIAGVLSWDSRDTFIPAFFVSAVGWLGMLFGAHVGWFGRCTTTQAGTPILVLKEWAKRNYPLIQDLRAEEWSFGKRPSDGGQVSGAAVAKFFGWVATFFVLTWMFALFSQPSSSVGRRTLQRAAQESTAPPAANRSNQLSKARRPSQVTEPDIFDRAELSRREVLGKEIESNKTRLATLSSDVEACRISLQLYEDLINSDRGKLQQMQNDSRAGLYVNEDAYEDVRRRHNANVEFHTAELGKCRSLAEEHDALVDTTNAKIREYNQIVGAR